jgi:hypothetical protein
LTVPVAMSYSSWRDATHDRRERLSRRTSNLQEEPDNPRVNPERHTHSSVRPNVVQLLQA